MPEQNGQQTERMSVLDFQQAIRDGRFVPGDAVLYRYGRRSPLAWAIAKVQGRALADLVKGTNGTDGTKGTDGNPEPGTPNSELLRCAQYTHAGMIVDAELSAEMTSPRARLISWQRRMRVGDRVLIVRPLPLLTAAQALAYVQAASQGRLGAANIPSRLRCRLYSAADDMCWLASKRTRYPWRELLTYWFASLPAAIAARHFAEYFACHTRNVCSGSIWEAWQRTGAVSATGGDLLPEAWYPGRMAIDGQYLQRVAALEVVPTADTAAADDKTDLSDPADRADREQETTMSWQRKSADAVPLAIVILTAAYMVLSLCGGCVAYRAPVIAYMKGPENAYNQERSSVQSRATNAEAQVAETTAAQTQTSNAADSNMPSALDSTRQVGLKQGQDVAGTQALGREAATGSTTREGQGAVGQQGGDATSLGQTPSSTTSGTAPVTINPATPAATNPAEASTTNGAATKPTYEVVKAVTANENGTTTVVTADGKTYVGKIISSSTGTDPTIAILQPSDGTLVRYLQGSGVVGQALCPGCSAPGVTITADSAGQ